jgi:hypothetical protein
VWVECDKQDPALHCRQTDDDVTRLAAGLPKLRTSVLGMDTQLTPAVLETLGLRCRHLESLSLIGEFAPCFMRATGVRQFPNVRKLALDCRPPHADEEFSTAGGEPTRMVVDALEYHFPLLQELDINFSARRDDDSLLFEMALEYLWVSRGSKLGLERRTGTRAA